MGTFSFSNKFNKRRIIMISLFNKKLTAATILVLSLLLVGGCSSTSNKSDANLNGTKAKSETYPQSNIGTASENSASLGKNTTKIDENKPKGNVKSKVSSEQNITEKIKNYIINGQENKAEAQKIKWSKTFLNRVDIEGLYKQYVDNGGQADDLEGFANYMTLKAPILSDWQELFKKDLYDTYGEEVVRVEHLKDDLYQAYIVKSGSEIPYVVVSSRTGYFHG
jgi:hypothetical protein